jgi:glutathione S-transferase
MADYTLYCFAQSGNAYKAALMLNLCEAEWTPRFVDFFNGETRSAAYRAINVMGEVPLLEHRGRRLSQSGVILDYLASHFIVGERYPEAKVNAIIKRHHDDTATLRRELTMTGLMARESQVYWRTDKPKAT